MSGRRPPALRCPDALRGIGTSVLNGTIDQSISLNLTASSSPRASLTPRDVRPAKQVPLLKGRSTVLRQG